MKATLKQINDGYGALMRLSQQSFPKDQTRLIWNLGRITKEVKREIETLTEALEKMMAQHGFSKYDQGQVEAKKIESFNQQSLVFMRDTEVEFWGHPFDVSEIIGVVEISPSDFADLYGWLIVGEIEESSTRAPKDSQKRAARKEG